MERSGGERKIATMVFADLVGSTELATSLDPEDLRGRLAPFFEVARGALEEHGGTVEKYIGDAVMAVFGAPIAHGDDPDRAVAAGLSMVERVAELDGGLAVRVGIEMGEVLALPQPGDLAVTGEAVNAAARLQQAAAPGEVRVGNRAAQACRRARLEPTEAVDAKGIDLPLVTFRALAGQRGDREVSVVPLVGREDDLEMLRLISRRAVREQLPQLVTVIGEAGIGKTRLAGELLAELGGKAGDWRTVVGRSPSYGHGIAFWALGEILRDLSGTAADAPAEAVEESLGRLLDDLEAADSAELAAALTVALRGADEESDAEDELKRAWRRFVALLAADRPLAIGLDDAHWADEGMLDLLEDVASGLRDAPVLILCTARPELVERRPNFGRSARNITQLELLPLDSVSATRLAEQLLPEERHAVADRIADAAGGNPFFTEEVSRGIGETGDGEPERLPDTVQAAIAARMDQLPPAEKRALLYAAVLGQSFSEQTLGALFGEPPAAALEALCRKALLEERAASESGHYAFRHQLIRDVAYSLLPRAERAELHERAAEALQAGESFAELSELAAYHLDHAWELGGSEERRVVARAALLDAAETAVRRGAGARGRELFEEAAALGADDAERSETLWTAAEAALRSWRGDHALRLFREAAEAAERGGEPAKAAAAYARAVEVGSRMHGISGDPSDAELAPLLKRGQELVADDDLITRARLKLDEAWLAWMDERAADIDEPSAEGLELARRAGDLQVLQGALDAATVCDFLQGRQRSALGHTRERLQLLADAPRTHALDVELSDAFHMIVTSLVQFGDFRAAAAYAERGSELDQERGVRHAEFERGLIPAFLLGEWGKALEMAGRVREAWLTAGRPPLGSFATAAACAGAIHGYRGEERAAAEWLALAEELMPAAPNEQRSGVRLMAADADLHRGHYERAAGHTESPSGGTQWRTLYLATRAEAFVRAGRAEAGEAIERAEAGLGEFRYARGVLLRARGIHEGDEKRLRDSLSIFRQIESPYQAARSGWLLGGEERAEAERALTKLGATPLSQ